MNKLTNEKFIEKFKNIDVNNEYTLLSDYQNCHTKIKVNHKKCGQIFEMDPNHLLRGQGCPFCYKKEKYTTESFAEKVLELGENKYKLLGTYKNSKTKVLIKHNTCKHVFLITPAMFIQGQRCPFCAKERMVEKKVGSSYQKQKIVIDESSLYCERELIDFILSLNKNVILNARFFKDIKKRSYFEVPVIVSNTAFKIYDSYYKDAFIEKEVLEDKKINLIAIKKEVWENKKEEIKQKISLILNSEEKFIPVRKCEIREVSVADAKKFFRENSLENYKSSSYRFGLYYEDQLLVIMTFRQPKTNQIRLSKSQWELVQYDRIFQVFGGFSTLLNYVINRFKIHSIKKNLNLSLNKYKENVFLLNNFREKRIYKYKNFGYGEAEYLLENI